MQVTVIQRRVLKRMNGMTNITSTQQDCKLHFVDKYVNQFRLLPFNLICTVEQIPLNLKSYNENSTYTLNNIFSYDFGGYSVVRVS